MSWPICNDECGCYKRGIADATRPARIEAARTKWANSRCYKPCTCIDGHCLKPKDHDGECEAYYQGDNEADTL